MAGRRTVRRAAHVKAVGATKKRKKRQYPEHRIQCLLASLLRLYYPELLWFAVPNGGRRSPADGKRFKDMGVRAGVYDIFVSEPTPVYPGFYVEMKAPKSGGLSKDQVKFRDDAVKRGYLCRDFDSALSAFIAIEEYLGIPKDSRVGSRPEILSHAKSK